MLVKGKTILKKAQKGKYAVGHFNINNLEIVQGIVKAAVELKSPIFLATSEGAIDYAGIDYLADIVKIAAKKSKIPITLHLDHGKDLNYIKKAIKAGYTSIMIDGSSLPYKKNVSITKKVVKLCKPKGISVEAEIGVLAGVEDKVSAKKNIYTNPDQAAQFVKETGCDSLAIAIGTSHGAYKFKGKSKLEISILKKIKEKVKVPLVLHGASSIPVDVIKKAKKYGAKLKGAKGVSELQIQKAIKNGICKVNIDSDLRLTMDAAIRKVIAEKPEVFDPRKILGPGEEAIYNLVKKKILMLGSKNKGK